MPAPSSAAPRRRVSADALVATDIHHAYGDLVVLDDVNLVAAPGRRIALVGDNGSGKSTLLRILAGAESPDHGRVMRPDDTALLEQELVVPAGTTIGDVVAEALAELRALARKVEELSALVQRIPEDVATAREYGDALELAQLREVWDADHRVDRVLRGLGLVHLPRSRSVDTLSGGQRARVAMAALLVRQPLALLLDEPTNHLDDDAVAFLEQHVRAMPGVVVVASHDRVFLDSACTDVVDLDPARDGVVRFGGSFSEYLADRIRARARWERAWLDRQAELHALRTALDDGGGTRQIGHARAARDNDKALHNFKGGRVQRSISRRVRNARDRLERLERDTIPRPPDPLRLQPPASTPFPDRDVPLLRLEGVGVEGRLVPVDLEVEAGDRLLVLGLNGTGKSTLLSVLAGELTPTAGALTRAPELSVALLRQDPTFEDSSRTPRAVYDAALGHRAAPSLLDLGLLRERDLDRPVGVLSEGQRRRLALALLVARTPEVLLLDEPTNHLSPTLVSELEDALLTTPAAVVVATHDRWLRARWDHVPSLALH